jgi:hypothetical protein
MREIVFMVSTMVIIPVAIFGMAVTVLFLLGV